MPLASITMECHSGMMLNNTIICSVSLAEGLVDRSGLQKLRYGVSDHWKLLPVEAAAIG